MSARTTRPSECSPRALARFARKVDRQWMKGAPAPMPKHWRDVCGLALAMAPQSAGDPLFHRALVAALRFALPRREELSASVDVWARDPRNLAALAVDLLPVIRTHARRPA
ncbi:MAG: hypothetical protein EPO40_27170 [Myxococcaceae bacterium]|nr:MAG: hypothetical protein EPO40_27170 [Myxococcaceae bacterium]